MAAMKMDCPMCVMPPMKEKAQMKPNHGKAMKSKKAKGY